MIAGDVPSSSSATAIESFISKEVADWDDDVAAAARFKSFSGQRTDWEPQFVFWRDLILKVARFLGVCVVKSSEIKSIWFSRRGLIPLCLNQVLEEMYSNGDILLRSDLIDPTSGQFYRILKRAGFLLGVTKSSALLDVNENLILKPLLKDRASDVIKFLSESNWTSTCIVTMGKFQSICKDPNEAFIILSYLCECGKAQYLSIRKDDTIEGVKVSLVAASLSRISNLDYDILRLVWTTQRLQQQLDVFDRQWASCREMALASFKLGEKQVAYRNMRRSKMLEKSRAKCTSFLERVEEVLAIIADAESTKKVSEAIQIGTQAIKEHRISIEEVELHLQELNELVVAQQEADEALGSMPLKSVDVDDDDVEEEFKKLEMEIADTTADPQREEPLAQIKEETRTEESTDCLSKSLSKMKIAAV